MEHDITYDSTGKDRLVANKIKSIILVYIYKRFYSYRYKVTKDWVISSKLFFKTLNFSLTTEKSRIVRKK